MAGCLRRSSRCLRVIQARLAIFHPDGGEMARLDLRFHTRCGPEFLMQLTPDCRKPQRKTCFTRRRK
jgi:hypothetical protein